MVTLPPAFEEIGLKIFILPLKHIVSIPGKYNKQGLVSIKANVEIEMQFQNMHSKHQLKTLLYS